jgi:uncharacterized protein (DUF1778 family)
MPSIPSQERTERLEARTTRAQKDLLKRAADLQGRTLSDFILQAASDAAMRVVEQHQAITLSAEEQKGFVKALLHPPKPGARLKAAARRYQKVLGE